MECVKTERENEGQRWMINKGVDTNYSNKPKLKISMFNKCNLLSLFKSRLKALQPGN